jgi:two-component system, chemotaxis family, chemotaxis protein CheY
MAKVSARVSTVVLVGHCSPDSGMLKSIAARVLPGIDVVRVNDDRSLEKYRRADALWLVNRGLDGDFAADDGIAIIERESSKPQSPVLLLVSNYPEAQAAAVAAGAKGGFGKQSLYAESTAAALRDAAGVPA